MVYQKFLRLFQFNVPNDTPLVTDLNTYSYLGSFSVDSQLLLKTRHPFSDKV